MPVSQRLWDSNVILDYLSGNPNVQPDCDNLITQAGGGDLEIVVTAVTEAEVAFLDGLSDDEAEAKIREFFPRKYIIPVAIDTHTATIARHLIRTHHLHGADAIHLATAIRWHIAILETTDPDLLKLNGLEGNPPITIQRPRFVGTLSMFPPTT